MWTSPWAGSPPALAQVGQEHPHSQNVPGCQFCVIPPGKGAAVDKRVRSVPDCVKAHSYPERGQASSGLSTVSFTATCPFPGVLCSAPVLRPAPGVLPRRVHSRCASLQGPEAEPLLPREYREPSHRSLLSHKGLQSFSLPHPSVSTPSPHPRVSSLSLGSWLEPRGQPAPRSSSCLLPPRLSPASPVW